MRIQMVQRRKQPTVPKYQVQKWWSHDPHWQAYTGWFTHKANAFAAFCLYRAAQKSRGTWNPDHWIIVVREVTGELRVIKAADIPEPVAK